MRLVLLGLSFVLCASGTACSSGSNAASSEPNGAGAVGSGGNSAGSGGANQRGGSSGESLSNGGTTASGASALSGSNAGGAAGSSGAAGSNGGAGNNAIAGGTAGTGTAGSMGLPYDAPSTSFGNTDLHAEKLGFYMVPDLDPVYRNGGVAPAGSTGKWCDWTATQASLYKLNQLLPDAWIRWDNETGHNTSTTDNVTAFVSCAENAGVGMIVSADAVDGYNNYWANQYVTGTAAPNRSLTDIANGPYLSFAHDLLTQHANVKLVETMNEPDGPWFVTDGDDSSAFDYYMGKLLGVMGADSAKIVGPAAAIKQSNIWKNYAARTDLQYFSYHTYSGWSSLDDVPGRKVHVTEYGGFALDPGAILDDLWHAETNSKLSGSIERIYYHQITDDGDNRGGFNHNALEGAHFAFRDWLRALILYRALASVSARGYTDAGAPDFVASDDGKGAFAALAWNNSTNAEGGVSRSIPNTSIVGSSLLYVVRVSAGDANTAECEPLAAQSWARVSSANHAVELNIDDLAAHAAVLVSTTPCTDLAN